jgi:hypothetical protein
MINCFITSEMIDAFIVPFEGKLSKVLVNLAQILPNNSLQVDLNTRFFCYFFQVGIHLVKWNKHPHVDDKLL